MNYLGKWIQFARERFNLAAYSLTIFVFLAAHHRIAASFSYFFDSQPLVYWLPLWLTVSLFFFKLRLFDEVKDLEYDRKKNPERPLPRGLLAEKDVLRVAFVCAGLELVLFGIYGLGAFTAVAIAVGYSLLMYREFFLSKLLRPHLTVYAVVHTFVVVLLSIAIFGALLNIEITRVPVDLLYFSLANWFIFNIFEFARKTFSKTEERPGVESYSRIFGKSGAVFLALVMAALAIFCLEKGGASYADGNLALLYVALVFIGLLYVLSNKTGCAKLYRAAASLYIILSYAAVAFSAAICYYK